MQPSYSIIIPVFNSALMLQELYQRLVKVMEGFDEPFEIIFIEDCGQDHAWEILQHLAKIDQRVLAIQLLHNVGQGSAILSGLAYAKGTFIITLDDDLQHPPEELPNLIYALRSNNNLDVVMGIPKIKRHTVFRRICTGLMNRFNNIFIKKPPGLQTSAFRIMRRPVAIALLKRNVPYPSLGPMLLSVTKRVGNILMEHHPRKKGKSGYTLFKLLRQGLSNIVGYSVLPLHLLAIIGIVGIVFCLIFSIYLLSHYFIVGISIPGWMTLSLMITLFSSFNFLAFSLLGEYVLRIMLISTTPAQWTVRHLVRQETRNTLIQDDHHVISTII